MDPSPSDRPAPAPLRAAMVRFPTIDRARWTPVVTALADLGFNAIDLPLAWREHERAPGVFDFDTGNRSLADMLGIVRDAGLRAIVRLGPIASDDVAGLCIPERVLRDRACQARTRRQNPVLVPDPPRMVPMPSVASAAFRAEVDRWVRAASGALAAIEARGDVIARLVVGDGPHGLLRDDPYEIDHHPDARGELPGVEPAHDGPQAAGLEEVRRETQRLVSYRVALLDAVRAHGFRAENLAVAVAGAASVSPAAHALAEDHALCLAVPPPLAGSLAIWRHVRHAVALCGPRGAHFDFWSGSPPYYPPARGSHTLAAARVALAAGARDFTVRMGCSGDRWVGALLSERGTERPHAPGWRELLALAAAMPSGREASALLPTPPALAELARVANGLHPLPLGLLGLIGLLPGEIATPGAAFGEETIGEVERSLRAAESALIARSVPVARAPEGNGAMTLRAGDEPDEFAARVVEGFAGSLPELDPPGGALVRVVRDANRESIIVQSHRELPVRVRAPGGDAWDVRGAAADGDGWLPLAPGATLVLSRERANDQEISKHDEDAPAATARASARSRPRGNKGRKKRG